VSPTWHNHAGNQTCKPKEIVKPGSLDELVELVRRAESESTTVRACGARHAWSDAALTDGYMILPDKLGGLLELDDGTLRRPASELSLARVLGGTHIHDLNDALDSRGQALPQMGGYDAQTIAGVVATSTHGSGLRWGAFPDLVHSLDLVIARGEVVRVEPADGITDPGRFASVFGDTRRLIQDDETFDAAVCGVGCMGIVHAVVIDVREKFWLEEVRTISTWEDTRDKLTTGGDLGEGDHYELFVNPYPRGDGKHNLLITRRRDIPDPGGEPEDRARRHPLEEFEASLPITGVVLRFLARHVPSLMVRRFDSVLENMKDKGYRSVSYKVFNIGEANHLPAVSMELCVGLYRNRHVEAVERMLEIAAVQREKHRRYHTSPFSLRFTRASPALASMMYHRDSMIMELILVTGTRGGNELLKAHEDGLAEFGARSHWGQINYLTEEKVRRSYPRWDDWLRVQREFNSSGVFDSPFTRRIGI
jgi:FAD binding domain-containing protein/D-arabinono-1,4-lactone oxidase